MSSTSYYNTTKQTFLTPQSTEPLGSRVSKTLRSYSNKFKFFTKNFFWSFHPSPDLKTQLKAIRAMESDKLYVENVRQFFGVPTENAEFLCEQAVNIGILVKKFGLLCPNDKNIIFVFDDKTERLPEHITCETCESLEREQSTFDINDLDRIVFYQSPNQ